MIWTLLTAAAVMLSVGLSAWIVQWVVADGLARYRAVFTENARLRMSEFFLFIDAEHLWIANLVLAPAMAALSGILLQSWKVAALCLLAGIAFPSQAAAWLHRRRVRRFDMQLPDALLALGSALRAGATLQAGLRQIVAEGQAPLAQEFGLMLSEQRLGVTMDESLSNLYRRVPTETSNLVVSALRIAADTGGNLAETLERIAATVRARLHMEGRIRALTAQGRMQARVVGALPLLLIAVLYRLEPDAMRQLWTTAHGWAVLLTVLSLETFGLWMIRRIVRIDV
jgi:tight adherence protein B